MTGKDGTHVLVFRSSAAKSQWLHAIDNNISCLKETATKPAPKVPEPKKLPKPKITMKSSPRASPTMGLEDMADSDDVYKMVRV